MQFQAFMIRTMHWNIKCIVILYFIFSTFRMDVTKEKARYGTRTEDLLQYRCKIVTYVNGSLCTNTEKLKTIFSEMYSSKFSEDIPSAIIAINGRPGIGKRLLANCIINFLSNDSKECKENYQWRRIDSLPWTSTGT